jgi:hypothetical protein
VNVLKTEKGDARLQKTDIFKKVMWFSYPREESWIPLPIHKVKEIQQQNKEGIIPADLGEIVEIETLSVKAPDYENVVGQDSLTRLDDRTRNKKKSRNKNAGPNHQQARPQPNNPKPVVNAVVSENRGQQQLRGEGNKPGENQNKRHKHRRHGNNRPNNAQGGQGKPTE